jgi:hypothetical protein
MMARSGPVSPSNSVCTYPTGMDMSAAASSDRRTSGIRSMSSVTEGWSWMLGHSEPYSATRSTTPVIHRARLRRCSRRVSRAISPTRGPGDIRTLRGDPPVVVSGASTSGRICLLRSVVGEECLLQVGFRALQVGQPVLSHPPDQRVQRGGRRAAGHGGTGRLEIPEARDSR